MTSIYLAKIQYKSEVGLWLLPYTVSYLKSVHYGHLCNPDCSIFKRRGSVDKYRSFYFFLANLIPKRFVHFYFKGTSTQQVNAGYF